MNPLPDTVDAAPLDQATGLRRMFAGSRQRLIPIAANPFVAAVGALLECVTEALVARGLHVLVVDSSNTAPWPKEAARLDLAEGVEALAERVSYLAARGLPLAHVDTRGSAGGFIDAVGAAVPQADVVLLHAEPGELARLLMRRSARPVLLGADRPDSIKHAYACCKLLAQRCNLMTFDLLLAVRAVTPRVRQIADSLASCADGFLGALLHDWAAVDPIFDLHAARDAALARLLAGQLALDEDLSPDSAFAAFRDTAARTDELRRPI